MAASSGARPVVCGVDDSDGGRDAAEFGGGLSSRLGAPLVLVHVEPPPSIPGTAVVPSAREAVEERERALGEALLDRIATEKGLEAERRVLIGDPVDRLVEVAEELQAAFLVVGSRGHRGLSATLLGSVSRALPPRAPCPVVVVPAAGARLWSNP